MTTHKQVVNYSEFESKLINLCHHSNSSAHSDFQKVRQDCETIIKRIHEKMASSVGTTKDLARDMHEFAAVSGAPLEEVSKQLSSASNRIYSKAYVSKLCKVGRSLREFPDLDQLNDIESLNLLSSVPQDDLKALIDGSPDLLKKPRASIKKELTKLFPNQFRSRKVKEVIEDTASWNTDKLKIALTEAIQNLHEGDQELKCAVRNCLKLLESN